MSGNIANMVFNGHGNFYQLGKYAYAQTFGFFCECLDIPNKYYFGTVFEPGDKEESLFYWNAVEIDGVWYYIDPVVNTLYNTSDYLLSAQLWEDHDIWREGKFEDCFQSEGVNYVFLLSQKEYKDAKDQDQWDVD